MVENESAVAGGERRIRENLASLREVKGWSQATLAEKLSQAGLPGFYQTTVARIEKGERALKLSEAAIVAKVFGVDLIQLSGQAPHSAALDVQALVHQAARGSFSQAVYDYTTAMVKFAWQADRDGVDLDVDEWFRSELPAQTPAKLATEAKVSAEAYLKRAAIRRTPVVKHLVDALKDDEKRLRGDRG